MQQDATARLEKLLYSKRNARSSDTTVTQSKTPANQTARKLLILLEAAIGIEPMNKGFADLCLTTWLRRPGESIMKDEGGRMK